MDANIITLQKQLTDIKARHHQEQDALKKAQKQETSVLQKELTQAKRKYAKQEWQRCLEEGLIELISDAQVKADPNADYRVRSSKFSSSKRTYYLPNVGELEVDLETWSGSSKYGPTITSIRVGAVYTLRRYGSQDIFRSHVADHIDDPNWSLTHGTGSSLNQEGQENILKWLEGLLVDVKAGKVPACPCRHRSLAQVP